MKAANIIVATDFSESSDAALQLAASLARDAGATLHIVHVKEPFAAYKLDRKYGDVPPHPDLDSLSAILQRVAPPDQNVPCRHWLFTGESAAKEILKLAEELDPQLIVMGTHGRTGLSRLVMGSAAEAVIRHAHCPVLTSRGSKSSSRKWACCHPNVAQAASL